MATKHDDDKWEKRHLFISHRHADTAIAHVLSDFVKNTSAGLVPVFLSSSPDSFEGVKSERWRDTLLRALIDASVLIAVYTSAEQDWQWVMWELGVATSPSKPQDTRIIVLQCGPDIPSILTSSERVDARSLEDVTRFVRAFLTSPDFFPGTDHPVAGFSPEAAEVRAAAEQLYSELARVLPSTVQPVEAKSSVEPYSLKALKDELFQQLKNEFVPKGELESRMLRLELEGARAELSELRASRTGLVRSLWATSWPKEIEPDLCFLLMPFSEPWSNDVWSLIDTIVIASGFRCERADETHGRVVMQDIWNGIARAAVVIADLTAKNPNVTYEVGLADVLGKQVILLSQTPSDVPFDFLGSRLITYENTIGGVKRLTTQLQTRLKALSQETSTRR
jgi:hypothetical protein